MEGFYQISKVFIRFHGINETASSLDSTMLKRMICGC